MADSAVAITAGSGTNIDTRTEGGNGNHRQVVVLGDPDTNAGVAPVDATAGLKVNLGSDNDVTVTGTVTADLGSNNDVTVTSGTVTANLGATDNAVLDSIDTAVNGALDCSGATVPVDLGVNNDVTVTGTVDLGATDNAVLDTIATNTGAALTDTELRATPVPVSGTVTADLGTNNDVTVTNDTAANLKVDGSDVTQPVSGTVTANLGATDNAVLDDIATKLGTIDADTGAIKTATETIDNAISGTEMQVDVVASLPAGTNAIGKLAANSGVDIGDVDVTSLPALAAGTNSIGKVLPTDIDVTAHTNYIRKYYTSSGAATDGIIWSPAAGKRWHVTSLYFQVSADATVTFEDDKSGGDDPVLKGEYKAGSGVALTFDERYPFASEEDAADLTVTTSAGNIYVTVVGYEV